MLDESTLLTGAKWELLKMIAIKPMSPTELAEQTNTSIANITQQLRLLEMAGLIEGERQKRDGKGKPQTIYKLSTSKALIIALTPLFAEKGVVIPTRFEAAILRLILIRDPKREELLLKLLSIYPHLKDIELIGYLDGEIVVKTKKPIKDIKQIKKIPENLILLY